MGFVNISARQRKMTKFFLDGLFVRVVLLSFCTKLKMETILNSTEQKIFQITWKIAELLHPRQSTIISKINGNINIQQSDKDLKENLLKMVVCGGTSFSYLQCQSIWRATKTVYFESHFLSFDFSQVTYWVQGQGSFGSHGSRINKSDPVSSLIGIR